jgi:hypothetical protein
VRAIDHPAADRQDSSVGLCLERGDNRFSLLDVVRGRSEGGIYDRHLRRMDRQLAREALAARGFGFVLQPGLVPKVGEDAVDRLDARSDCTGQAQGPRELVGER